MTDQDDRRLTRIEGKLDTLGELLIKTTASLDSHMVMEDERFRPLVRSLEHISRIGTDIALLKAAEERQTWWNRSMVLAILGIVATWIASKLKG